jgi:GMP synthase (glutamine-hydrolysing)
MDVKKFIREKIEEIRGIVGGGKALSALSGGVDSAVCTLLAQKALGDQQLTVAFLDDGLMRVNEANEVRSTFAKIGVKVNVLEVQADFFAALKGLVDPEEKRKAFRETFYKTIQKAAQDAGAAFMVQGTIKPDIIETQKGVKTQHNVLDQIGISAKAGFGFTAVEPLVELYKPDVRKVGKALGLPTKMHQRQPFPGPGLSARVLGEVTPERVEIVRRAGKIIEQETARFKPFQAFAVLFVDRATGVTKEGTRAFGDTLAIRCVDSKNAVIAQATKLPWATLKKLQERIVKEIPSVNKVLYDLTPKPPSTIEYV